jgi:hypothetical protein
MLKKMFLLIVFLASFAGFNCSTTDPGDVNNNGQDTTSHNFNFATWTFGEHSSSVLYDVAVINDSNIWAVGEIYSNDSLSQPDPNVYNAVYWNGNNWELKRISFTGCGAVIYPAIVSVFAFNKNDIWFARGGSLVHFDGNTFFNDCNMNSY